MFPSSPAGKMLCQITGDRSDGIPSSKYTFPMPEYVALMSAAERQRWMHENNVVPVIQGGAYSMFEMFQPFQQANGTALTGGTALAAISLDTLFTVPANVFSFVGKTLWLRASGVITNVVTTPGTVILGVYWGGTGGTLLRASGAITPTTVAQTSAMWYLDFWMKARAVGGTTAALTLYCYGMVNYSNAAIAAVGATVAYNGLNYMPSGVTSMAADISGLNGTIAQAITVGMTPSVTGTSTTMQDGWIAALN